MNAYSNLDFSKIKILVLGDLMLDQYILGKSNRMSPEAPVPVITPETEYTILGGSGNVVRNLCNLGAQVSCIGVVGDDIWGKKIVNHLSKFSNSINISYLVKSKKNPTTLKQRIYLEEKQLLRIDKEKKLDDRHNSEINDHIDKCLHHFDIIILSDYDKGVLNKCTIANVVEKAKLHNIPVVVDPKKTDFSLYKGANILTPNLKELSKASRKIINDNTIVDVSKELIKQNNFDYIITTKGDRGMTIVGQHIPPHHIDTSPVKDADVTGAGDTVIATFALTFALCNDIFFAVKVANYAANYVVQKMGTGSIDIDNLNRLIKAIDFK